MTITRVAYERHSFVQTSIDLLCAGASWRGGAFIAREEELQSQNLPEVSEKMLTEIAKSMLLDGQAHVEVTETEGKVGVTQISSADSPKGGTIITIERVENGFSPKGVPILERIGSNIDFYEKVLGQS
jgi:hypothetical protein